jgi:hypothetical protein
VLIVVGGADAQSNAKAQQEVDAIVEAVAQGKIKPPKLPGDEQSTDEEAVDDPEPANPPPLAVSSVKLDRKDEKERWLLKCLLQVEEDLADIDEPMVFAVYGQCRANPPLVGDGINAEELTKQVQFVLGPCTCTIKEQNLGLDLLARFDWHSVALALAKRVGPETGNEHLLGADAFPNLFPKLHEPAVEKPKVDEPAPAANKPADTEPTAVAGQAAASHSTESAGVVELAWSYRVRGLGIVAGIIVLAVVTMRVLRSPGV